MSWQLMTDGPAETYGSQEFLHIFTIPGWGWKGYSMILLFWDEQSINEHMPQGDGRFSDEIRPPPNGMGLEDDVQPVM